MNEEKIIKSAYETINLPVADLRKTVFSRLENKSSKNKMHTRVVVFASLMLIFGVTITAGAVTLYQHGKIYLEELDNNVVNINVPIETLPMTEELRQKIVNSANYVADTDPLTGEIISHYTLDFKSIMDAANFFGINLTNNQLLNNNLNNNLSNNLGTPVSSMIFLGDTTVIYLLSNNIINGQNVFSQIHFSIGETTESISLHSLGIAYDELELYVSPQNGIEAQIAVLGNTSVTAVLSAGNAAYIFNSNFTHETTPSEDITSTLKMIIDSFE